MFALPFGGRRGSAGAGLPNASASASDTVRGFAFDASNLSRSSNGIGFMGIIVISQLPPHNITTLHPRGAIHWRGLELRSTTARGPDLPPPPWPRSLRHVIISALPMNCSVMSTVYWVGSFASLSDGQSVTTRTAQSNLFSITGKNSF